MPIANLQFDFPDTPQILCIGSHCDDIEIGCSGTILRLLERHPDLRMTWLVLAGNDERHDETRESAKRLFAGYAEPELILHQFRDGFLPYDVPPVKEAFENVRRALDPHLILSHWSGDFHQDHRVVSELTWSTFRRHLIMEYEIPKYDGDLGRPNVFVPLSDRIMDAKIENLLASYRSQAGKSWFEAETFRSLHRIRGMESGTDNAYAEGFHCRKANVLS